MANFCTQCGTPNTALNASCEGCGHALHRAAAPAAGVPPGPQGGAEKAPAAAGGRGSQRLLRWGLGGVGVVLMAAVGLHFALSTPSASRQALRDAAQHALAQSQQKELDDSLCLGNMGYEGSVVSINPSDERTKAWMNALVSAGLYAAPSVVTSNNFFYTQRLQYAALPELSQWRVGRKLCLGKSAAVQDVVDIQAPQPIAVADREGAPVLSVVLAKVVYQPTETAPWLAKPEVQQAVASRLGQWQWVDGALRRTVSRRFVYREGQWLTGRALDEVVGTLERSSRAPGTARTGAAAADSGIFDGFRQMFSGQAHPLVGTWRMENPDGLPSRRLESMGPQGMELRFTQDSITFQGQRYRSNFEIDGDEVLISMEGGPDLTVRLHGPDRISMASGLGRIHFRRH